MTETTPRQRNAREAMGRALDGMKRYEFRQNGYRMCHSEFMKALDEFVEAKLETAIEESKE